MNEIVCGFALVLLLWNKPLQNISSFNDISAVPELVPKCVENRIQKIWATFCCWLEFDGFDLKDEIRNIMMIKVTVDTEGPIIAIASAMIYVHFWKLPYF